MQVYILEDESLAFYCNVCTMSMRDWTHHITTRRHRAKVEEAIFRAKGRWEPESEPEPRPLEEVAAEPQ